MNKCYSDVKAFMLLGQPDMVSGELRAPNPGGAGRRFQETARALLESSAFLLEEISPVFKDGRSAATILGALLMTEELGELLQAAERGDLVEFADGLADLVYVTVWTALAHGIDLPAVWAEVQRSNLAKFPECGNCAGCGWAVGRAGVQECSTCSGLGRVVVRDASGKVHKPPGWAPPDIAGVLARQGGVGWSAIPFLEL